MDMDMDMWSWSDMVEVMVMVMVMDMDYIWERPFIYNGKSMFLLYNKLYMHEKSYIHRPCVAAASVYVANTLSDMLIGSSGVR